MIKPPLCSGTFTDTDSTPCRCHKQPGHSGECGYDGEEGGIRWYLHNVPEGDPKRPSMEERWHDIMVKCEHEVVMNGACIHCACRPVID